MQSGYYGLDERRSRVESINMSTHTPRTDAKCSDYAGPLSFVGDEQFLPADFARTLERELAETNVKLAATEAVMEELKEMTTAVIWGGINKDHIHQLAQLRDSVAMLERDNARLTSLFLLATDLAERYFDPGPVPADSPTDSDIQMGNITFEAQKLRTSPSPPPRLCTKGLTVPRKAV